MVRVNHRTRDIDSLVEIGGQCKESRLSVGLSTLAHFAAVSQPLPSGESGGTFRCPPRPLGLKALDSRGPNAALKAPLFHG